jgi:hypothetical protein
MALEYVRHADLDYDSYRARFPEIAVEVNWRRFRADGWLIRHFRTSSPDDLLEFFTCYRLSLGRVNGHFLHWLFSRNMTVRDVLKRYGRVPQKDKRIIEHFASIYIGQQQVRLELPTLDLPGRRQFLADGNHRAVALALARVPFELDLYAIQAPPTKASFIDSRKSRDRLFLPLRDDRMPAYRR